MSLCSFILVLAFISCAPHRVSTPSSTIVSTQTYPNLANEKLLGLEEVPGLLADPSTGERALPEVLLAYEHLKEKAGEAGWHLFISSGYRNFQDQAGIWNHYFKDLSKNKHLSVERLVLKAMRYKNIPGLSRHHWGTELDISEKSLMGRLVSPDPHIQQRVADFYKWMDENAPSFGFCRIYRGNGGSVNDEPWHWSYWRLAEHYERQMDKITDFSKIEDSDVEGMDYIKANFQDLYHRQAESVNHSCVNPLSSKEKQLTDP